MARLIHLRQARLGYGPRDVAGPLDLGIDRGDFLLVAGPNGSGKSTLIKTLMGVLPPRAGERTASVDGRPIRFGYVPQREHLDALWPFSVLDICLMGMVPGLKPFERFGAGRKSRAKEVLEQVGMGDRIDTPFRDLSGGQQQRALIARALVSSPDVLVLDEPTNHLDVPGERAVYELLGAIHRDEKQVALVVVTHHLEAALPWATRLLVMRDGSIQHGSPQTLIDNGAADDLLSRGRVAV